VVVFITLNYAQKVSGSNVNDNCQIEFKYAQSRGSSRIIAVLMEEGMKNPNTWTGAVGGK
jgi:hypothetical protein